MFSARYAVTALRSALGVTRQGYYAYRKRAPSARDRRDAELAREIGRVLGAGRGIYGSPKVYHALRREGVRTSRKRVARIMRENGWRGATRGNAGRPSGERRVARSAGAPDLVRRDFSAGGPDEAWFADITYVRTHQGRPCLAVAMDVRPGKIVGWSMGPRMGAELADDALKMAIAGRRPPAGCARHGGHGAQRMSLLLGATMRRHGIRPSMGSVASPWDNAVTESLMGIVKSECVHARCAHAFVRSLSLSAGASQIPQAPTPKPSSPNPSGLSNLRILATIKENPTKIGGFARVKTVVPRTSNALNWCFYFQSYEKDPPNPRKPPDFGCRKKVAAKKAGFAADPRYTRISHSAVSRSIGPSRTLPPRALLPRSDFASNLRRAFDKCSSSGCARYLARY